MTIITYKLLLEEPAIFSALEGDPNSAVTQPYVPGSTMRGLLIGLFLRANPAIQDLLADEAHRELFFSSSNRFLNAYPVINGERSLPSPATWSRPKYFHTGDPHLVRDSAFLEDYTPSDVKQKNVSGFVTIDGGTVNLYQPEIDINVHTQRARKDAKEQEVFRYEALASGQIFAGAILCDEDTHARQILNLLRKGQTIVIGGSRTAGYGRATIIELATPSTWDEIQFNQSMQTDTDGDFHVMTFLSDALIIDAKGVDMPTPHAIETALGALGIPCTVDAVSLKTTWIGGFNRKWGLPLPQRFAIESGSVVKLRGLKPNANLDVLQSQGLGDRRDDGFGRVIIGWQQKPEMSDNGLPIQLELKKYRPQPIVSDELSDESNKLFKRMRNRIRERRLEEEMAGILYDVNYTVHGRISRTQISRLRTVIANELRKTNPQRGVLNRFLTTISGKSAGYQFDSARMGNRNFGSWLKDPVFEEFGKGINGNDRYVLQLVDTILERAYRDRDKKVQMGEA